MTAAEAISVETPGEAAKDAEFLRGLASCQLVFGNTEKASNLLSLALFVKPDDPDTLHSFIRTQVALKRYQVALDRFPDLKAARGGGGFNRGDLELFAETLLKMGRMDHWRHFSRALDAQAQAGATGGDG